MNNISDFLYDREKLRAQVKKWKFLFILAISILVFLLNKNIKSDERDYIAKISLEGVLLHEKALIDTLKDIQNNSKIKALLVEIDSPGGSSFAGEELYETLKKIGSNKPIVAILGTTAASGGYMVALGAEHIIARNMTLTGSIGVLLQSFEAVEFANKLGIKFVSFKSSPLKAAPNPTETVTEEVKKAAMETINDSYSVFLRILMESRKFSKEEALKLADGKVYTGKRAKELKLIDEIGGEEEALLWLEKNKNISSTLRVKDIEWRESPKLLKTLEKFFSGANTLINHFFGNKNLIMSYE